MNVAFIPVRSGSKSIPHKNIKLLNGKPLVYWAVSAACGSKHIDTVYVATDGNEIKNTLYTIKNGNEASLFNKLAIIERSDESATDTASTEFAMLEFANKYNFDNIALIQATSPLLLSGDIDKGFEAFQEQGTDSVLSVVRQKRFNWQLDKTGFVSPSNYDVYNRPFRQNFQGYYVENGAFYITSRHNLLKHKNRLSGNIKAVEMNENSFYEIDEISDWRIVEELMKNNCCPEPNLYYEQAIPKIKMLLTDCDGCLTDGGMYYSEFGDELKKFNTKDGHAFKLLKEAGIVTGIVTGEQVELNKRRANKMNIDVICDGVNNKKLVVQNLCDQFNIPLENVAYVGDDMNDIEVMKTVGYPCCPSDAVLIVKKIAKCVTDAKGGEGVIREITDKLLNEYTDALSNECGGICINNVSDNCKALGQDSVFTRAS